MSHTLQTVETGRPSSRRPLGVWLLTIYHGLNAGLLPLILVAIMLQQSQNYLSLLDVLISALLALGILISAVAAWQGRNVGRLALVTLLTIHYGVLALNNAAVVISPTPHSNPVLSSMRVLRSLFWIGINCWYFLGNRPRAFFGLSEALPTGQAAAPWPDMTPEPEDEGPDLGPQCGRPAGFGDVFCGGCGTRLQAR